MSRALVAIAAASTPRGGWLALLLGAALLLGCENPGGGPSRAGSSDSAGCRPCSCGSATVVDPGLIAFLSKARAAHRQADLAEHDGDVVGAVQVLARLAEGPVPGGPATSPEVREVLADTRARLAELRSAGGAFDLAARDVAAGLALAVQPTHFRGRLLEVRGLVEERRAAALDRDGDAPGARAARERAVEAYEAAMDVQEQVIGAQLGAGGGPGGS